MLKVLSKAEFDRDIGRLDDRTAKKFGWRVIASTFPVFDVVFEHATARPIRLRLKCEDWDDLPPSIEILNEDGTYAIEAPPHAGSVFNGSAHPSTGRIFVCMRGAREFHTHPSHLNELWANYRGQPGIDLLGLVSQLWRAWKRTVR
ncbi:hypothetical protein J2855_003943 [Agrobacterium tumefaciens]|uniref:hypothetical protein n=1 Tax=Agrobacterium tumefaciens TaxID=358 RepID=UPI000DCFAE89|nr:hypothetical protein [Agrobacterium tumefaciens]MBP2510290.1 hypothetical protein [Agrobacterium tumefaciens]MBP2519131.1 hypothetical protein [Agrobacterium tumefaciens]MBP2577143.1 hypothetical protein [Agrobacterium tumefaciens]MBP2596488.1 hypothetical protein [Agrobacterium tumefaciens]MDP9857705.1 hypothetical protein [Agrobacterium tumefaciens]